MSGRSALAWLMLLALALTGCEALRSQASVDSGPCPRVRLDQIDDLDVLFADPNSACVIVAWDTDMPGAGPGPDGGIGTPAALDRAARSGGFAAPCETTIDPHQASVTRGWFQTRFGGLSPAADAWGVTFFRRAPSPDGKDPGCVNVTPPS